MLIPPALLKGVVVNIFIFVKDTLSKVKIES